MSLFSDKRLEATLALLQAENVDLRSTLRQERDQWNVERQQLLDRILALSHPASIRELRREPTAPVAASVPRRPNLPGYTPDLRPPARKPQSFTDNELVEVVTKDS
jgi:hypothetical protein